MNVFATILTSLLTICKVNKNLRSWLFKTIKKHVKIKIKFCGLYILYFSNLV